MASVTIITLVILLIIAQLFTCLSGRRTRSRGLSQNYRMKSDLIERVILNLDTGDDVFENTESGGNNTSGPVARAV